MLILNKLAELLFPARCPVCDAVLPIGTWKPCAACERRIRPIEGSYCIKCGKPVRETDELCGDCLVKKHSFVRGRALFGYRDIKPSVMRFKYGKRPEYARWYASRMAEQFGGEVLGWKPDVIIGVPAHRARIRKRGYNQSQLLAGYFGKELGIEVTDRAAVRGRSTSAQKKLDRINRQNNLINAFQKGHYDVKSKIIVIVDDIYTTGSTVDALSECLLGAGASAVYFVALSIGNL